MSETDHKGQDSTVEPECSGSGTTVVYTVEARLMYSAPRDVAGVLLDQRWKRLHFDPSPIGVPAGCSMLSGDADRHGFLSYPAAQALRWWFHATAHAGLDDLCLESRIVKHKWKYSYSSQRVSDHAVIGGDDRSNTMPDWGTANCPAM